MDFDAYGKLTTLKDRNGNAQNISYSGQDIYRIIDSYGRYLEFNYSGGRDSLRS